MKNDSQGPKTGTEGISQVEDPDEDEGDDGEPSPQTTRITTSIHTGIDGVNLAEAWIQLAAATFWQIILSPKTKSRTSPGQSRKAHAKRTRPE